MFPSIIFSWHNHLFIQKYHLCFAGDSIETGSGDKVHLNYQDMQSSNGLKSSCQSQFSTLIQLLSTQKRWFLLLLLLFSVSWSTVHYPSPPPSTLFSNNFLAKARWIRLPVKPISTCFLISSTDCCWLKWSIFPTQGLSTLPSSRSYLKITLGKDLISLKV